MELYGKPGIAIPKIAPNNSLPAYATKKNIPIPYNHLGQPSFMAVQMLNIIHAQPMRGIGSPARHPYQMKGINHFGILVLTTSAGVVAAGTGTGTGTGTEVCLSGSGGGSGSSSGTGAAEFGRERIGTPLLKATRISSLEKSFNLYGLGQPSKRHRLRHHRHSTLPRSSI